MSVSRLLPAEWDAVIVRYLAAGQTQRTFCSANDIPYDSFRVRYRKSARFAGKRRGTATATAEAPRSGTWFVAVRSCTSAGNVAATAAAAAAVTIRLEGGVAIECPLLIGIETIASLAREAAR